MENYDSIKHAYEEEYDFANGTRKIRKVDEQFPYIIQGLNSLEKKENIYILDAGCGDGMYINGLKELGYTQIIGLDLFDEIADKSTNYVRGSIDELPFEENVFDFVYCTSCVNYLEDVESGIKEMSRVLKKGGILLITVTTKYSLFSLHRILKKILKLKNTNHINYHMFKYSLFKYIGFLKQMDSKF